MHRFLPLSVLFLLCFYSPDAQQITRLQTGLDASIRGLSVVNDHILWISGSKGSVARSIDGGEHWKVLPVPHFEDKDFRDIEAFDDHTAIIMAVGEPALILKTTDGGGNWKVVFRDSTKGMFLDAMDFFDKNNGIVVGDPMGGKFYIAKTHNGGESWARIPLVMESKSSNGEACFAASGTNIQYFRNKDFLFVSGGLESRLHDDTGGRSLDIIQGKESAGANSIAVRNTGGGQSDHLIIVGGDFTLPHDTTLNCIITYNEGRTWIHPATPPHGYRSCVEYITNKRVITCGISGVDVSADGGLNWTLISTESFNVCLKAKKGSAVYLAGNFGSLGKLVWK